jgi:cytochrome c peroxidase
LYQGKAGCEKCHPSEIDQSGKPPLFTDFSYHNIGAPKNLENPFYSMSEQWNPDGNARALRNVDLRPNSDFIKSYTHNGFFKSLEEIVNFYNTRDVNDWSKPEVSLNVDTMSMENLGLTSNEELAPVAFLKTLSDGYNPDSNGSFYLTILIILFVGLTVGIIFFSVSKRNKLKSRIKKN